MSHEKRMRAAGQAMRADVQTDSLIIALKSPAVWLAGASLAAFAVGLAHLSCLAAAFLIGVQL